MVSPQIMDQIVKRAAAMGATKSEYAALIIHYWYAQGGPPINERDRHTQATDATSVAPGRAS